eukprot:scaffold1076_cov81-Cylindrotheca_fusiformis.AAC.4
MGNNGRGSTWLNKAEKRQKLAEEERERQRLFLRSLEEPTSYGNCGNKETTSNTVPISIPGNTEQCSSFSLLETTMAEEQDESFGNLLGYDDNDVGGSLMLGNETGPHGDAREVLQRESDDNLLVQSLFENPDLYDREEGGAELREQEEEQDEDEELFFEYYPTNPPPGPDLIFQDGQQLGNDNDVNSAALMEEDNDLPPDAPTDHPMPEGPTPNISFATRLNRNRISIEEEGSYDLITLMDSFGAPRNAYDRLLALLRKQKKNGFDVIKQAIGRDVFLKRMQNKFGCPSVQTNTISDCTVFSFPFAKMLQDLVDCRQGDIEYFDPDKDYSTGTNLLDTKWASETYRKLRIDPNNECFLPLILYMDKTGCDAYQRYPLEPVLFSLANFTQEKREDRRSWRHLGFVPSSDNIKEKDSETSLQFYHNCLGAILAEVKEAQQNPPTIQFNREDGTLAKLKARVPLMIIMGDQLSQDTLCARAKANAGGAGRVHRSCMCSYLSVDDPMQECVEVNVDLIGQLTSMALASTEDLQRVVDEEPSIHNKERAMREDSREMKFLLNQRKVMKQILSRPYTTHAINNAFDGMCFGAWTSGVYDATFDDFMHGTEAGLIKYIGESVFGGLQPKERSVYETVVRKLLLSGRSSVRYDYPRMRVGIGFSRQTLMTSSERVGTILMLALSLQLPSVRDVIGKGHERQIQKYKWFPPPDPEPTKSKMSKKKKGTADLNKKRGSSSSEEQQQQGIPEDYPMYYERFFNNDITKNDYDGVMLVLEHLGRHGFDLEELNNLDDLQIHQLIVNVTPKLAGKEYPKSYPATDIEGHYFDRGRHYEVPGDIKTRVGQAMFSVYEKHHILSKMRFVGVRGTVDKHHREKPKTEGVGPTSAVLCDTENLSAFLELVLTFHAFCKYSSTLPSHLRDDKMQEAIENGGRLIVLYFERFTFRGVNSVDSRTTKIHAQLRIGLNYDALLSPMHSSTELGERLLKTEAKGISSTAQQRGTETFERQTCSRIGDRLVLDKVGETLEQQYISDEAAASAETPIHHQQEPPPPHPTTKDDVTRRIPHFKISRVGREGTVVSLDRKGNISDCTAATGRPDDIVVSYLLENEPLIDHFEIYNEVIIRNDTRIRAWPNYRQSQGPWFDFVDIQWEDGCHPGRALGFYKKKDEETGETVLYALVHVVDEQTENKVPGTITSMLTDKYCMKYERTTRGYVPVIRIVPLASINTSILAYLLQPASQLFDHRNKHVMALRPRNEWAYIWLAWTEELVKANSKLLNDESLQHLPESFTDEELQKNKKKKRSTEFVPLNDKVLWKSVRENLESKLSSTQW